MLDINKTASLDVDSQQGFTPLQPDELPVIGGDEIVNELNANAKYAKYRIASKDAHSRNADWVASEILPQFTPLNYDNADLAWNPHCNVGEEGFELLPGLPKMSDYDFIVYKGVERNMHPYGACYHDYDEKISTGLIEWLTVHEIETVIVGGLTLDYCVKVTIRQLLDADFNVILNLASTRAIDTDNAMEVLEELKCDKFQTGYDSTDMDGDFGTVMSGGLGH